MPLIMSSLTLQPNLFHEFHPIGGVNARFRDGEDTCAKLKAGIRRMSIKKAKSRSVFMHHVLPEASQDWYRKLQDKMRAARLIYNSSLPADRGKRLWRRFMTMARSLFVPAVLGLVLFVAGSAQVSAQSSVSSPGLFDSHADVGTVLHPGSVEYDAAKKTYTISGSGENMWLAADAFQFVWKKISGDVTLTADISFLTKTGNEHKKAVVMLRQSLDADSVYADVALHASGLTSLQFRDEKRALTREIQANQSAPKRLRI